MHKRIPMRKIKEILRLKTISGLSERQIANCVKVSRTVVSSYYKALIDTGSSYEELKNLSDQEIFKKLFPCSQEKKQSFRYEEIDFSKMKKELSRKFVTKQQLFKEYQESNPQGIGKTQFFHWFREWEKQQDPVMRQHHKAGEKCFVDYSEGLSYKDSAGMIHQTSVFVICWGASNYIYAEATETQNLQDWINSHVRAFEYFGCVPHQLVPDNLKSGVTKANYYEPEINKTYNDLAIHYNTAVVPARIRKPQDKALVEISVKLIQNRILAALRNKVYTNLKEMNEDILKHLDQLNSEPLQKMDQSRKEMFLELDSPQALQLPSQTYEFAQWKKAKVHCDYHIEYEKNYYSVPYHYIRKTVHIRATEKMIEIFHKGERIASHRRQRGERYFYTEPTHMPVKHQKYANQTPQNLIERGHSVGEFVGILITEFMEKYKIKEQSYRGCLGILSLQKKYGQERLNLACKRALYFNALSYKLVKKILEKELDQQPFGEQEDKEIEKPTCHNNTRGAEYFQNNLKLEREQNNAYRTNNQ